MSDTPRTDAAILAAQGRWTFQLREQMKQMEVELNAANARIARLEQAGDGMHQYILDEYGTQHIICMIHWREEKGRTA